MYDQSPNFKTFEPKNRFRLTMQCWNFLQSMGARNRVGIGLSYRPARLQRLAELVHWNRFLGSLKVKNSDSGGPLYDNPIPAWFIAPNRLFKNSSTASRKEKVCYIIHCTYGTVQLKLEALGVNKTDKRTKVKTTFLRFFVASGLPCICSL